VKEGLRRDVDLPEPEARAVEIVAAVGRVVRTSDGLFNLFGAPPFKTFVWAFQK
jgi:hypothetical protein